MTAVSPAKAADPINKHRIMRAPLLLCFFIHISLRFLILRRGAFPYARLNVIGHIF